MLRDMVMERIARERQAAFRLEAERDRLVRAAEVPRPAGAAGRFLGRVRERIAAPRGAAAALPRTPSPSGA